MKYLFILTLLLGFILNAKESKLEIGTGLTTLTYPDYIGSKSYKNIVLPLPYIDYRSEYLYVDKGGINRKLFDNKNLTLDLSVTGSLPVNSEANDLREGMPDLNFTFEVGPKLSYRIYSHKTLQIYLDLAVRSVFETDLRMLDTQGFLTTTELKFELEFEKVEIIFKSGFEYGDKKYHNYFYGVTPEYETSTRNEYKARAGYNKYKNKISATYRDGKWWYGAFVSHLYIRGAVYEDSPLVETDYAFFMGAYSAYIFYTD